MVKVFIVEHNLSNKLNKLLTAGYTRYVYVYFSFQKICGTIKKHLMKNTQIKFYKVVARPSLLYGSETWVTTTRDMTRPEAAEMRILRSVKGYTTYLLTP
jgi:uncharacterized membrane protein YcgQ (UPF0703/DUF1980 family)